MAGRDLETVQEIKDNFLRRLRTNERAVTKFDFPNVMMLYPNQEMIDAKIQLDEAENTVIVYVLFKNMPQEEFPYWPMDFDYTKMAEPYRGLNEYLAHRSMVNIHTYVVTAKRQPVDLTLSVTAQANYRNEDVRNRVYAAIADYFAEENVKIGHPVIMSDLICALQDLEGVYLVHIQTLQDSLIIADDSYATLGTLNVTVDGGLA